MTYEPLHHKYRPQTFADLVGQEAIATTLTNALLSERIAPAYLFTGPRGTGKTSSARILAKSLNCIAGNKPTPDPCGQCEVCRAIARGNALDVIEIDAASNTGVDNIREIIERSQFSPVQCRYKVYVIDECLTGDTLVLTHEGLKRIDSPDLKGKQVLSYNEITKSWEYKLVTRWLDQGKKQTLSIKTNQSEIKCTENHLIRTETGWIKAKDLKIGMKILSPANVGVEHLSRNTEAIIGYDDLSEDINLKEINSDKKATISNPYWNKQNNLNLSVFVDAAKNWTFRYSCTEKDLGCNPFNPIGNDIPIKKDTDSGKNVPPILFSKQKTYPQNNWGLFTEPYWEMGASVTPTSTADSPVWAGHIQINNKRGWNIKHNAYLSLNPDYKLGKIRVTETYPSVATLSVILSLGMCLPLSDLMVQIKRYLLTGLKELPQKELLGGIWMMLLLRLVLKEAPVSNSIPKDIRKQKTTFLPTGLLNWDIWPPSNAISVAELSRLTFTCPLELKVQDNFSAIFNPIQSPQWTTNLEEIESVTLAGCENVYDLEVKDNHNFVANGLLVHNCHMLSVAAFNALLKTLEEPPERVIFVLATTDPQRVLPTIISRCQRFDYRRIPLLSMVSHLRKIADLENIKINDEAVTLVAQIANGGLRDAESLLDQLSLLSGTVDPEKVWDLVGAVPEQDLLALLDAIASDNAETVLDRCRKLMNRGREPLVVLQNLAGFYLNLLIAKSAPKRSDLVAVTAPTWQQLCAIAPEWDTKVILHGQQQLKESEVQLRNTTQPRLWLEVTLLNLLPSACQTVPTTVQAQSSQPKAIQPNPGLTTPQTVSPAPPAANPPVQTSAITPTPTSQTHQTDPPETTAEDPPKVTVEPTQETVITNSSDISLPDIWQAVLARLIPTTQSLLRSYGNLILLEENYAQIAIKNESLLKLVTEKITNLEAAFKEVCGRTIRVKFTIGSGNVSPPPGITQSRSPTVTDPIAPTSPTQPPPNPSPPVSSTLATPHSVRNGNEGNSTIPTESKLTSISPTSRPSNAIQSLNPTTSKPAIVSPPPPTSSSDSGLDFAYTETDLQKAAESLAKVFEGEIVVLEDGLPNSQSTEPEDPLEETSQLPQVESEIPTLPAAELPKPLIQGRPHLADITDDDDIPF